MAAQETRGERVCSPSGEHVAIIGMSGRFPGAPDLASLWTLLAEGTDAIREIPRDRYDIDAVFDPRPRTPGRTVSRWGGLLDDIDAFDADFFGISPREAARMDPQQRILLEVAYEALSDAGQPLQRISGSDTGVFIGQLGADYWQLQYRNPDDLNLYSMTGAASRAITSGRLSYAFDLRGPSVTIDTACSSSLVAVHQAIQSLRLSECGMALVGGVNLVLLPEDGIVYSGAGMLAADGRCKFGDASGDGFVRSDGVGVVILKPLSRALADGDRVRAVLRGSAVGNDGRSSGYLVTPGVEGQLDVLTRAYRDADADPAEVAYVECHGTGTNVGDPVELEALSTVVGANRDGTQPCLLGSIKTNIGHTEGTAGIAGLIKTVLCLEHGMVPPSLHLSTPNPAVPWDSLGAKIPTASTPLPDGPRPTLAGVSSFGFSGTNAHVVLESAPARPVPCAETDGQAQLLALSAATPEALRDVAQSFAAYLDSPAGRDIPLRDICHSAAVRQTLHDSRLALAVKDHKDAAQALKDFATDGTAPGVAVTDYADAERPRVAFVFPGQGSQWAGMGRELLDAEPVFASVMAECDAAIRGETGWSVIELLRKSDPAKLAELDVIQPTLWAMEVAMAALWRSWGVEPDVVIGHSMGESAAACVAGALTLTDASAVICRRSRLAKRLSGLGAMAWTELSADEAIDAVSGYEDRVAVAASNGPRSTLLSGEPDALKSVLSALDARDVFNRWINVDFASHCPQMDAIRADLLSALSDIQPQAGTIPLHSTLLNRVIDGSAMDALYWARNIREPVDFVGATRGQLDAGTTIFIEISPHPVLVSGIRETARERDHDVAAVGSTRRDEPERFSLLSAAAELSVTGVSLDFERITPGGRFTPLPAYPWQHESYWLAGETAPEVAKAPQPPTHPLLGRRISQDDRSGVWEGPLDLTRNRYLRDHQVQGSVIMPGTAYLELLTAAGRELYGDTVLSVRNVCYRRALFLDPDALPVIRVTVTDGACSVHSRAAEDEPWVLHAEASLAPGETSESHAAEPLGVIQDRCPEHQTADAFYPWHAARGNQWRGAFQGVAEVWRRDGEALARLRCPDAIAGSLQNHQFHPAFLDASGHSMVAARPAIAPGEENVFVLGSIGEFRLYRSPGPEVWTHARLKPTGRADSFSADLDIRDADGSMIAELRDLRLQYLSGTAPSALTEHSSSSAPNQPSTVDSWFYDVSWEPGERPTVIPGHESPSRWLVLADSGAFSRHLVGKLRTLGHEAVVFTASATYQATGTDRIRLNPGNLDHLVAALSEISAMGDYRGIIHLWSLDAVAGLDATAREISRAETMACGSLVNLVQALERAPLRGSPSLWLVTRNAQRAFPRQPSVAPFQALIWGLGRSLAAEQPALGTRLVDLDDGEKNLDALVAELEFPDDEDQITLREGRRFTARLVPHRQAEPRPEMRTRLTVPVPGVIDDLSLHPAALAELGADEVLIRVSHAGVNFRDVLMTLGVYPGQDGDDSPLLGWECSGVIEKAGSRVTGMAPGDEVIALAEGALGSHVTTKACLAVPKPPGISMAAGAVLPGAYLTAYYALHHLASLSPGDRLLIHSATGGVGQAAISIARWKKARVFATAGSPAKRALLSSMGVEHVADSRSLDFGTEFQAATGGGGFDAILNSLAGEAIPLNLSLMAPYGHYLELSKLDILSNNTVGLGAFTRNLSFHAIDVVHMIQHEPERAGEILREAIGLVGQGVLEPLPYREYDADNAAEAFRLMSRSGHTGKLVVRFPDAVPGAESAAGRPEAPFIPIRPEGAYLVTGGAGGIGSRIASWLADRGARHLVLTGRTPLSTEASDPRSELIQSLAKRSVDVQYAAVDIADARAMSEFLRQRIRDGKPPLRGVIHAAGTVEYMPVSDMCLKTLSSVLRAKVTGAWNLHRLLLDTPLELFVLFSSASGILASPMLSGYAAGNTFLDTLAHHRRAQGLPATTVDWGFWNTVGMVARRQAEEGRSLVPQGMTAFSPEDGIAALEAILAEDAAQTAVLPADWKTWAAAYPTAARAPLMRRLVGHSQPTLAPAPVSQPVRHAPEPRTAAAPRETPLPQDALSQPDTQSPHQLTQIPDDTRHIADTITTHVAAVLGLPPERVNRNRPLNKMGMDSLMAVEIRTRVERELQTKLPIVKLLEGGSITTLTQAIAAQSPQPATGPVSEPVRHALGPVDAPASRTAPSPSMPANQTDNEWPGRSSQATLDTNHIADTITTHVAAVLGLPPERVNRNRPLNKMGMDSLMAVEIRTRVERELQTKLPIVKLLEGGSITTLTQAIAAQSPQPATDPA